MRKLVKGSVATAKATPARAARANGEVKGLGHEKKDVKQVPEIVQEVARDLVLTDF